MWPRLEKEWLDCARFVVPLACCLRFDRFHPRDLKVDFNKHIGRCRVLPVASILITTCEHCLKPMMVVATLYPWSVALCALTHSNCNMWLSVCATFLASRCSVQCFALCGNGPPSAFHHDCGSGCCGAPVPEHGLLGWSQGSAPCGGPSRCPCSNAVRS